MSRSIALAGLFLAGSLGFAAPASAAPLSNAAAGLFAERVALLAADQKCALLKHPERVALNATTTQARGIAIRDGWTDTRLDEVSGKASQLGRARACNDSVLGQAAQSAKAGYLAWARMFQMELPGQARVWRVRRTQDLDGWMMWQDLGAARFGLRTDGRDVELQLSLPGIVNPVSTQVFVRDRTRAPRPFLDVPGVVRTSGLAAAVPPRAMASSWLARAVSIERLKDKPVRTNIVLPAQLFAEMGSLDPRESAEIVLAFSNGRTERYYVEIGDLAVAQAFLAAKPI
jgi:hypothetical protein